MQFIHNLWLAVKEMAWHCANPSSDAKQKFMQSCPHLQKPQSSLPLSLSLVEFLWYQKCHQLWLLLVHLHLALLPSTGSTTPSTLLHSSTQSHCHPRSARYECRFTIISPSPEVTDFVFSTDPIKKKEVFNLSVSLQKTTFQGLSLQDAKRGFSDSFIAQNRSGFTTVRRLNITARTAGASKTIEAEVDKPLGLTLGQKPGGGVVITVSSMLPMFFYLKLHLLLCTMEKKEKKKTTFWCTFVSIFCNQRFF